MGEVCWGVGEVRGEVRGVWRKVRGNGGEKKCGGRCGRPYEVSLGKCVGVWGRYEVCGGR